MLPRHLFSIVLIVVLSPGQGFGQEAAWREGPDLPTPVANNGVAAVRTSVGRSVFSFLGIDSTKIWSGVTSRAFRWDVDSGEGWREIEAVPGPGRLAPTAEVVGGEVFLFGGYTVGPDGSEESLPNLDIFDPGTEEWSRGADLPIPVDDAVSGVWRDSLIYLVSGWHNVGNESAVQIYDPAGDRWRSASPIPGPPVFGHAGAIAGNTIVYLGGAKVVRGRPPYVIEPSAWRGEIDPRDPSRITWARLPDHPGPPLYRTAAGSIGSWVLFLGGTDNPYNYNGVGYDGVPSTPSGSFFGYNVETDEWATFETVPPPTMDHRNLAIADDRLFLVGGMEAEQRVTAWTFSATSEVLVNHTVVRN